LLVIFIVGMFVITLCVFRSIYIINIAVYLEFMMMITIILILLEFLVVKM